MRARLILSAAVVALVGACSSASASPTPGSAASATPGASPAPSLAGLPVDVIAGTGQSGGGGDGGPATEAQFQYPVGLAFDANGNLYVTDAKDNTVRRIGMDGIITAFAGDGTYDSSGDGGPALDAGGGGAWAGSGWPPGTRRSWVKRRRRQRNEAIRPGDPTGVGSVSVRQTRAITGRQFGRIYRSDRSGPQRPFGCSCSTPHPLLLFFEESGGGGRIGRITPAK